MTRSVPILMRALGRLGEGRGGESCGGDARAQFLEETLNGANYAD
jgi:hypothetical protein